MAGSGHPPTAAPPARRRRLAGVTAVVAVLLGGVVTALGAAPASAATVDTTAWYALVNRNSGKALDVYNFATNDGARITQWTRSDGTNQQWQFVDSGGGYYRVKSRLSGKVLDVQNFSTADGGAIVQWADNNSTNQQFRLADSDGGHVRLVNRNSNKAVEVQGASTADGGNVVQYSDWGGANQQWQLVRVGGGTTTTTTTTTTPQPGRPMVENNFQVTREGAYGDNRFTVFRPSDPQAVGRPLPVLAFGNGACAHTNNSEVTRLLTAVAAKGIAVVDIGSANGSANGLPSGSPIPSLLTDALTWAEREQNRSGAALSQRLDLTRMATAGHSCGGLEALIAAQDRRVDATVSLNSGLFADGSFGYPRSELSKLHAPVLYLDGGPSDIAYDNTRANYNLTTVPAVLAENPQAGHGGFITGSQMTDAVTAVVQFLDMVLNGNQTARDYILEPSGLASKTPWTVARKNF
ncbi:RICIN domain-containing protein [Saccharothrix sp. 6-C]|uniref:RICIN domain-containing protein n=1 Tax=Saccharothrix sp. 6-C TaxID=2781735 RepID=UPI001917380A|nr:RICIN domain-containing protein [Saccharothrix sp. 6-C]